jgi:hypothetical protein
LTSLYTRRTTILIEQQMRTTQMTSREAALEYHRLDLEGAGATSFARSFEDSASESDFDEYLRVLDLVYGEAA